MSSGRDKPSANPLMEGVGVAACLVGLQLMFWGLRSAWKSNYSFLGQLALLVAGAYLGMWGLTATTRLRQSLGERLGWIGHRRYRVKFTAEFLVYSVILIVLFAGSMLGRSNMLRLVFCLLAGPFVLNGQTTFWILRRTSIRRSHPSRVVAGDTFTVDLSLTNGKRRLSSWMMEAHDRLHSEHEDLRVAVLFTRVPPQSERTGHYRLRLMNRGRYQFGEIRISSRFPLGLTERAVVIQQPSELLVYPQIGKLKAEWEQNFFATEELVHPTVSKRGAFDDEFHRLREYQPGDSTRSIHWRTSARLNSLMVRDYHQHRDRDLMIVLDLRQPSPDALAADPNLIERAVSLVATLCVRQCRQARDSELWLAVQGRQTACWSGTAGLDTLDPILEVLALAQPAPDQSDGAPISEWVSQAPENIRRIYITTRSTAEVDSRLRSIAGAVPFSTNSESFQVVAADAATVSTLMDWN